MRAYKSTVLKCIIAICIAFFAVTVIVFSGCDVSADWVRSTIQQYYFRFDGDYSDLQDMSGLSISDMVKKLDPYSDYYTREEYEAVTADNEGSKSGIGVSYSFVAGTGAVIRSVVGNSPAKGANLRAGDILISGEYGGVTTEFTSLASVSEFVSGRGTGEQFTLNLSDGRSVTLAKENYTASYACMYLVDRAYSIEYDGAGTMSVVEEQGGVSQLPEGAAYIYLSQFFGNASREIGALISKFNERECTSLILDLRGNGGGYVDIMAQIGGRFTSALGGDSHIAMIARYKDGSESTTYCAEYSNDIVPAGTEVYVMADSSTASASEALIGVLISYNILDYSDIFLTQCGDMDVRSYGKGIMQSTFTNLLTGEALKLTVAGIYWQNGRTIHGVGVTPEDGCVPAPASDNIVNVGYDDELIPVIEKILSDRASAEAGQG